MCYLNLILCFIFLTGIKAAKQGNRRINDFNFVFFSVQYFAFLGFCSKQINNGIHNFPLEQTYLSASCLHKEKSMILSGCLKVHINMLTFVIDF